MIGNKDPMAFFEAAYDFGVSEHLWMEKVVETLRPYDLGGGVAGYVSDLGPTLAVRSVVNETRMSLATLAAMLTELPPLFYRRLHDPMPLVYAHESFQSRRERRVSPASRRLGPSRSRRPPGRSPVVTPI